MKKIYAIFLLSVVLSAVSASAQRFEPKWVGDVNILAFEEDTIAIPAERSRVVYEGGASATLLIFGIGEVTDNAVVRGKRSSVQFIPGDSLTMIVRYNDNKYSPSSVIQIIKMKEKRNKRQIKLSSLNWLYQKKSGEFSLIPFTAERYGTTSYILKMPIIEGEFGVRVLNPDDQSEKMLELSCFGVHNP